MEFMSQRGSLTHQPQRAAGPEPAEMRPAGPDHGKRSPKEDSLTMWSRLGTTIILFFVAILAALVTWFIYSSSPASQSTYVDGSKLQAVFLNSGQVYFGNIKSLNQDYVVLGNVYYLQSSSTTTKTTNQNVSLVKLGCELHKPYDTMVINSSQVTFWENLQTDGQVAKAVAQFEQQNPNGQKCSTPSSSSTSNPQSQASTNPAVKP